MDASIKRRLERGLTAGELIAELQQYDEDARVVFTCDYGDYCHTQQALPVEHIEASDCSGTMNGPRYLVESAYSKSGLALQYYDDEDVDEESGQPVGGSDTVVILS
jgi:hypothetical protein